MDTRALGGIQHRLHRVRDAGLLGEARQATLREGVQSVADGLHTPADMGGNLGWGVALCTGQYNLATAQSQRMFGAQTAFEVVALLISQRTNKDRGGFIDVSMTQGHSFAQDLC
jgi:hypothetical protein